MKSINKTNEPVYILDQKFKDIIEVLKENPFQNPHPYEKLVGNLKDKYSRCLNS